MLSVFIKFLQSAKAVADPQMQSVFSVFVTYIKKKMYKPAACDFKSHSWPETFLL